MNVEDLSMQEKIGQMLIVGLNGNSINERIKILIQHYKIGGVILYRKNFNTYEDMLKLIKDLKELNKVNKIPLFISIDQEGGRVNRMPKEFKNLPAAYKIAKTKDEELIKEAAKITGEMLYNSGVNMNFAPVLDIKRFDDNHAIGDRCYAETKEMVTKYGIEQMKELKNQGVIPVIKHFPGHGLTSKDSHYFLPIVRTKIQDIENIDMKPFEEAIINGAEAIMVGHLIIKDATGTFPASLSRKFIGKYLRKKFKFNGLVITDDLKMSAIRFVYGYKLAIKKAFLSGSDIIVLRFGYKGKRNSKGLKNEKKAMEEIEKMVKSKELNEGRINRSVKRILKIKEEYKLDDLKEVKGANINEINERIEKIKDSI